MADGTTSIEVGIVSKVYQAAFALNIIRNKRAKELYQEIMRNELHAITTKQS